MQTTWTRDKSLEEGGSHRVYRASTGQIVERRYWSNVGLLWQIAISENDLWETRTFPRLADAQAYASQLTREVTR